ncbi:methylated-DNA--[protein]-cysteine S-methyltransferase [Candidatus Gracilibacteria bacterium]|nr:methylated-DNA--[protein]-cysteine S-methyltransferase [Candidatus Gracilibacteria bacterium]
MDSPIGLIEIKGNEHTITGVYFTGSRKDKTAPKDSNSSVPDILKDCALQILEYFEGKREVFDIPVILKGTELQRLVWQEVQNVQYGKTITFSELAKSLNRLNAVMVIGQMVHNNPIQLLIPDHRIITEERILTGHEDDIYRKDWLIRHEQRHNGDSLFGQNKFCVPKGFCCFSS